MDTLGKAVHFVLQKKGGAGKSFVAAILAQYLVEQGVDLVCYDTDPNNKTLSGYSSLNAKPVELLRGTRVGEDLIDPLMSEILGEESNSVLVDTGTSNYLPTISYLVDNTVVDLLHDAGRTVFVHVPVSGGGDAKDTVEGLADLVAVLGREHGVKFVVWENDIRGMIEINKYPIYHYLVNEKQLAGVIPIRIGFDDTGAYRGDTYVQDIKRLTESRFLVDDLQIATEYSDGTKIDIMKKHRMRRIRDDWFKKLDDVTWE
jgi:hypothetical protein